MEGDVTSEKGDDYTRLDVEGMQPAIWDFYPQRHVDMDYPRKKLPRKMKKRMFGTRERHRVWLHDPMKLVLLGLTYEIPPDLGPR